MGKPATKPTVLVVDDEPSICALLSEKLRGEGYDCQTCSSGEEALKLLERESFNAIISDLKMPGISGMQLLKEARKKYAPAAFLMVTGVGGLRAGIEAMKHGAADYLVKPFRLDAVLASVRKAIEINRLELEVENYRQNLERMVEQRTKQLQSAMKRIELTYDETLEALGGALDLRDNETAGHSRRVSLYCLEMARKMPTAAARLTHIARGSYLHDIGKIGIPDAILLKPGKLTEEETAIMQTHVRIGYDLVSRIAFLAPAAEIVLTHQERYDGTGYPQGLVGNEIPLGARIFAVADTLDAMTSDRPYRKALPYSATREEIERESERQFDPEVVKVFLSIPEKDFENIRRDVGRPRINAKIATSGEARHEPRCSPAR